MLIDVRELGRLYREQWVVLDHLLRVVDHGPSLRLLRAKYAATRLRQTFLYVPGGRLRR